MDTITVNEVSRQVDFDVEGAPPVTGMDARGHAVTIAEPRIVQVFETTRECRASVTGLYRHVDTGMLSAVFRTITLDLNDGPDCPEWLWGLAAHLHMEAAR